jgi:uncharacterized phiE125 gp8 family phage protein
VIDGKGLFKITVARLPRAAVTFADMAEHLRLDGTHEASLVDGYARAATATAEQRVNRLLVRRQVNIRAAALPDGKCPATIYGGQIGTVSAFTVDGEAVASDAYAVVGENPAALVPVDDWPSASLGGLPVSITYTAGYAEGDVPDDIRIAVMMLTADMFETRTQHIVGTSVSVNPAVDALLMPWRIMPV